MSDEELDKKVSKGCPVSTYRGRLVSEITFCSGVVPPFCICAKCEVPIPRFGRSIGVVGEDSKVKLKMVHNPVV